MSVTVYSGIELSPIRLLTVFFDHKLFTACFLKLCLTGVMVWGEEPGSGVPDHIETGVGQLGSPLSWSIPDLDSRQRIPAEEEIFALQDSMNGQLYLTPNESFFPSLKLRATGESSIADISNLNGGKSFHAIEGWSQGAAAQWAWWAREKGGVQIRVVMQSAGVSCRFELRVGERVFPFVVASPPDRTSIALQCEYVVNQVGKQDIELLCLDSKNGCRFLRIELDGEAVENAAVIRKRWRPSAAHTRFSASTLEGPVRLWVMEMDALPGTLPFYSPITTPFGYYGPTWLPDGRVNTGFNFSLWSYGRGKAEPPVEELSHLLAIGNRNATFGSFGHEGTGVKIRDWEPLKDAQGQSQVFALRVEPGEKYNTYYSYYFNARDQSWRLFGVGNQYNRGEPLDNLWVGSFVEVPGPPQVQRTGVYPRRMRYRGWLMDQSGEWFAVDRMSNGNIDSDSGLTHTRRGVTDEGWFYLETGGWGYYVPESGRFTSLSPSLPRSRPSFLNPDSVKTLLDVSTKIRIQKLERSMDDLVLEYEVENGGEDIELRLFSGSHEGLTLSDRWDSSELLRSPKLESGQARVSGFFKNKKDNSELFLRMLLTSDQGQFWSPHTWVWDTSLGHGVPR